MSIGTCPLHITYNRFRSGIKKLDFNVDSFAIDVNFFFKLSAARRADSIDIGSLTEFISHFFLKHSSMRWVILKRVCVQLLEQFESLKRFFLEFLPTTSTLKRIVKETDPYKRTVELTVPYTSFDAFIANDFEHFLIKFQSLAPRIYLLYTEMVRLIKTVMSKFVKSRLLVDEMNFTKVPKSITYLQRINVTDITNFKPINQ